MREKKLKLIIKKTTTQTIMPQPNNTVIDDEPPNLLSNTNNMLDLVRNHKDKYNLTHVRYLLSLTDNEWKSNFTKKYSVKETKQWLKQYRNLLTNILEEDEEEVEREYTIRGNNRLYADGGIQTLEANLRNFIQAEDIKDYDMVCAQPSILLYLSKKCGLDVPRLQYFCDNRLTIFETFGKQRAKDAVCYALFCDRPKPCGNPDIDAMIQEFLDNRDILIHTYKENINPNAEANEKNPKGSKIANILCYWECKILNSVVKRFGDGVNTLLFDGFYSCLDIPIETLNSFTQEYGIKWKVKPLNTCYELPDDFDPNSVMTYKQKKAKFEEEVCLITFAENFKVRDEIDGSWKSMTEKGVRLKYKNWREKDKDGDEIDFLDKWLKDTNRTDYNRMCFHPYSLDEYNTTHHKEFNTFKGFRRKNLGREITDDEVKPFTDHLHKCFGWEGGEIGENVVKMMITHIAHIVKKPHKKIQGILVLRGYEGTGKDTIKEIFIRMMSRDHIYECEGMTDIITKGSWNDHLVDKLVVVMNEVKSEDGIKNIEGLKQKATTKDLNVKEKFMKNQTMNDLNNMIVNSNNNCPIIISPTDRRYCLLITNEDLAKVKPYWNAFYKYLDDDEAMDKLYTWLLQQDVDDYDFENDRVITDAYRKLATKNISEPYLILYKYLTDHIENNTGEWSMKTSTFNNKCITLSKHVLERNYTIKKGVIRDNMEKIPKKYLECIARKDNDGSSCMTWIVPKPQEMLERLMRLEFQYFDPTQLDLDSLDQYDEEEEED